MFTRVVFIGAAVMALGISQLAAQAVGPETVQALRLMAIRAGQTSSSADQPLGKSREPIAAERQAIEMNRADFIATAYSRFTIGSMPPLRLLQEPGQGLEL